MYSSTRTGMLGKSDTRCVMAGLFVFPPSLFFRNILGGVRASLCVSFDFPQEPSIGLLFWYAMALWAKRTTGRAPIL